MTKVFALSAATFAVLLAGCTTGVGGTGDLKGDLPLCYGPAAPSGLPESSNLTPKVGVTVYRGDRVVATRTFRADLEHRKYHFTLPAGFYVLKIKGQSISARVKSGKETRADFRPLNCL